MTVTLRQRKKGDKISLYLDYYGDGKRDYEYLQLYIIPEPEKGKLTKEQKEENRKTMILAEAIRSKRLLQIKNEEYGFRDTDKAKGSFIAYFERLTEKRKGSEGNWGNWDSVLKHLKKFAKNGASFKDVDKNWLEDFKTYLISEAKSKTNKHLSQNSQSS
ncbi:MAG TPA: phage integrase SAM-like domain and Arm DNA-binding domain-containing protein, partial [Chitinophagaceae bacterium]|nr:phage integrase SAM-like domain and Arm DNA-binding domain-containing protein [Chitinophagaceae bacterium]